MTAFSEVFRDLGLAWRTLVRAPAFFTGAVAMMAGALGVSAAAFGMLSTVVPGGAAALGRERVVNISPVRDGSVRTDVGLTQAQVTWLRETPLVALDRIVEVRDARVAVSFDQVSRLATAELVHGDYFGLFEMRPAFGRMLSLREAVGEGNDAVVVSSRLASYLFGLPEKATGSTIWVSGKSLTVVGVAIPQFLGLSAPTLLGADLWVARGVLGPVLPERTVDRRRVFARLKAGADLRLAQHVLASAGQWRSADITEGLDAVPAADATMPTMLAAVVWATSSAILLVTLALVAVASANLACLMTARANSRATEVAIRVTLGASRWRVMRLLLSESVWLLVVATALGALLARGIISALAQVSWAERSGIALGANYAPDWRLYVYVVICGLAAAIMTGLWSARRAVLVDPARELLSSTGSTTTGKHGRRTTVLVAIQFAVSTVLLFGAALTEWNARAGLRSDPGFETTQTLIGRVDYSLQGIDEAQRRPINARLLDAAAAVPGVRAAALITGLPIGREGGFGSISGQGGTRYLQVAGDAFGVLGIQVRGRTFNASDQSGTLPVAIVNEALAAEVWPERQALGQTITLRVAGRNRVMTVVGVAVDTNTHAVVREHRRTVYLPLAQLDSPKVAVIVRGEASGASLVQPFREALQSTLPMVAVYDLRPVAEELGLGTQGFRLASVLLLATGGFALLVTWVGLYAVTAYLVSRRLREFGLMRALGARDLDIYRSVVEPVIRTVGIGASSGILVSVALVGLARHYLVGFGTAGWGLVLLVPFGLSVVVIVAALVPAWRATRQEPMGLLRQT